MRELPPGWAEAKLDQVAEWGSGGTPSRSRSDFYGGSIPWIKTGELGQGVIVDTEEKITQLALKNSSAKIFPKGSVAIAMYGATIGKVAKLGIDAATNQACGVGIPMQGITTTQYLLHYLASQKEEFVAKGQGGAQPNISQTIIKSWPIPLAPFPEQQRIADKLDVVLSKVDACRARLDRVPHILKKFREAVLEAAVSGRLTEEWRAQIGGEARGPWTAMKLAAVCRADRVITYGVIKLGGDIASGIPCLRTSNVRWLRIEEEGIKRIAPTLSAEFGRTILRGDEVLVNVRGTLGGVAAVVPHMVGWNVSREVAVVPAAPELIQQRFLALWIATNSSQRWLTGVQKGVAYTGINIEDLRALPVRVPSLIEQSEIVRRVDQLFVLADRVQRRYDDTVTRVEQLTPSVLAKAFRGEMVPQDPNDEPAGEMLERIRQQTAGNVVSAAERRTGWRVSECHAKSEGGRRLRASSA
jgi:type I restriction enzyme, S subunit